MAYGEFIADGPIAVLRANVKTAKGGQHYAADQDKDAIPVFQRHRHPLPDCPGGEGKLQ